MSPVQLEHALDNIIVQVWHSLAGWEPQAESSLRPPLPSGTSTLTASISFSGAWTGMVALHCTAALARAAAASMFAVDEAQITPDMAYDALAELTNITAGNLESFLPEPCRISSPSVTNGEEINLNLPGCRLVTERSFLCKGQPLQVRLVERLE